MSTRGAGTRMLFITDLNYPAAGRRYGDEDVALSRRLGEHFRVALCHPRDAPAFMDDVDLVLVRNSGPVANHPEAYRAYRARAAELGVPLYTQPTGRGDQAGKQYLVDLSRAGLPVIPTIDTPVDLDRLPDVPRYVVKPKDGADSVGLRFVTREEAAATEAGTLIQPQIDFAHEVSFYFVDHDFQYALYAPDPTRRWELHPYEATRADLEFAGQFIEWNSISRGIQRVDACRAPSGELLLVELEDLNPYLSLDRTTPTERERFIDALVRSLKATAGGE